MAAVMQKQGYTLVTDDVLAVQVGSGAPIVLAGLPQLKLWPDTAALLGYDSELLAPLHPRIEKRAHRIEGGFSQISGPLRRIYVLAEGPVPALVPLTPREGVIELVRHSYAASLLEATAACSHFSQCARLANTIAVSRLERHRSLDALADIVRLLERDFSRDARRCRGPQ
jgi:hypothetical protein